MRIYHSSERAKKDGFIVIYLTESANGRSIRLEVPADWRPKANATLASILCTDIII